MPAQERVRLNDHEGLAPLGEAAGEDQQPEAIATVELRTLDLAVEDGELLTQQSIFGDQFRLSAEEVGKGVECERGLGWSGPELE